MNTRKILAWALIILGLLDLGQGLIDRWGWTNYLFGNNFFTKYAWSLMVAYGADILRKEKGKYFAEIDDIDLDEDEEILMKEIGHIAILKVTPKRLLYRIFNFSGHDGLINVPNNEFTEIKFSEIADFEITRSKDIGRYAIARNFPILKDRKVGVRIIYKNEESINLIITKSDLIIKLLRKALRKFNEKNN
jgi:hypothetical protein